MPRRRRCRPRRRPDNAGARSAWRAHSPAQARQNAMQFASSASSNCRCPALLARDMMLPVALQTAAQSRLSRMQATRCSMSRSARQASAQAVQVSTQLKQESMQRLIASALRGLFGMRPKHGADGDGGHGTSPFRSPSRRGEPMPRALVPNGTSSIASSTNSTSATRHRVRCRGRLAVARPAGLASRIARTLRVSASAVNGLVSSSTSASSRP